MKKILDWTTIKFLIVGVLNTLVGTATMFLLYNALHMNYWVSSAGNYVVGSIVSFFLNKYFTFRNKSKSWTQVLKFIVNISICYLLAYGVAKPLTYRILEQYTANIKDNIAMLVGMCLFVVLNYFGQRFIVFKKEEKENE